MSPLLSRNVQNLFYFQSQFQSHIQISELSPIYAFDAAKIEVGGDFEAQRII